MWGRRLHSHKASGNKSARSIKRPPKTARRAATPQGKSSSKMDGATDVFIMGCFNVWKASAGLGLHQCCYFERPGPSRALSADALVWSSAPR